MKQTVIFFAILITLFYLWFTDTINNLIDDTDVSIGINEKALATGSKSATEYNANGNEVIVLKGISIEKKKRLWNNSDLKLEMIELFPKFTEIKYFVEEHIEDDAFKKLLLAHVEDVEFKYIGGALTVAKAKQELSNF